MLNHVHVNKKSMYRKLYREATKEVERLFECVESIFVNAARNIL